MRNRCSGLTLALVAGLTLGALGVRDAQAGEGAVLSCVVSGNVTERDQATFVAAVEGTLASNETKTLKSLEATRTRLQSVAPEATGCFTKGCLVRAGQALEAGVGYQIEVKEEFEFYVIDVKVYDLYSGEKLKSEHAECEICTTTEAIEATNNASRAATQGWTYPAPVVAAVVVPTDKVDSKKIDNPPVDKTLPAAKGANVRVALFANPADTKIMVDGKVAGDGQFVGTLPAGSHSVRFERSGFRSVDETIDLREGDGPTYMAVHLRETEAKVASADGRSGGWIDSIEREPWAYGLTGGGAILTITGAILLGIDGETTCSGDTTTCPDVFATGGGGGLSLGLGVAALTSGIVLFLWDDLAGESNASGMSFGVSPTEDGVGAFVGARF